MTGEWTTGKDIMREHGKAAAEIGQACYDGVLHAFTADVLFPVLEESKLAHIPKYPPVGVDPRDHVQYTATPHWDWSNHLKIDSPETERQESLSYEPPSTTALRELGLIPFDMDVTRLNKTAVNRVHEQKYSGGVNESIVVPNAALALMEKCFDYMGGIQGEARRFCFLFQTFNKWYCAQPGYSLTPVSEQEIVRAYRQTVESLWFKRNEVTTWLEQKTDQVRDEPFSSLPAKNDSAANSALEKDQIEKWTAVQRHLQGSRLVAAKLAVQKWHGKSHVEAYAKIFSKTEHEKPVEFVSKKKNLAEKIIQKYPELAMPPWNTSK